MKIISDLENLQTKINNVKAPILQEIEANNEKISKIEIKKSELLKEINSNDIRPIIKTKKLKELNNINSEIAVLNEDNQYLQDKLKFNDDLKELENELSSIKMEIQAIKSEKVKEQFELIESLKAKYQEEYNRIWNGEYKDITLEYMKLAAELGYDLDGSKV